jgi:DNA polymerase-3 subunit alpha
VQAPCIQTGAYQSVLKGVVLVLGFNLVNGIERNAILNIIQCRNDFGYFKSFEELLDRVYIPFEQLILLIRIDALRCFGVPRKELLWQAHFFHDKKPKNIQSLLLLGGSSKQPEQLPELKEHRLELDFEYLDLMGFSLCSPFELLSLPVDSNCSPLLFSSFKGKIVQVYGYLVALKNSKSSKGQAISFGMFLDQDGLAIDTVHFQSSLKRYPFSGSGIYFMEGKLVEEFGFYCLEVRYMKKQSYIEDPRFSDQAH